MMANDNGKKGFAGLDSMISDVASAPESSAPANPPETAEPSQIFTGSPVAGSRSGGSREMWGVAIAVAIALFAWLVISNKPPQPRPPTAYEATAPSTMAAPTTDEAVSPSTVPSNGNALTVAQNGTVPSYSSYEETVPPVGTGLTLERPQIRYCLSERIRMEAWQGQLNINSQTSVDAFNASVNDYNARCSNYRYRSGDLESVRAEVESNRAALAQQGVSRAASVNASAPVEQNLPAIRTSFDCTKARSDAEHLICNDAQLAAADVDLANLFASAKAVAADQVAFKEHTREQWNYRERNCHDRDCLVQWYAEQRQWLTNVVSNSNVPTQPEETASSPSVAAPAGNCVTTAECAKAMLVFAGSENLAGAMDAARTIDLLPKPQRGDRATARKLNQDALSALNASRPDDAVKLLEQANQADPGDEEIASNLAYAYAADGQLAKSEDTAVLALSLNPRRTAVWAPLAVTLAKENRLDQATEAMWLAYQFSADKQKTLNFIDSRLALETDPAVVKMYSSSKDWLMKNTKPTFH
ncbi:tetratricopeptide repeat protein [Trinickia violacea]|uniref:Tetratricopeptide repeat protein n=1 Tax=Trinickia violacea TaxID=2571746 RepID=A0A4P8IM91_9BURK|nr:tetratricopeptide repeat protein [Trinickia violacea]QCP47914.1 tetratricopeptide repeat protein [Trinickia violacea]